MVMDYLNGQLTKTKQIKSSNFNLMVRQLANQTPEKQGWT